MLTVTYIISDINKALAFEWIADQIDKAKYRLNFILIVQQYSELEGFLRSRNLPCQVLYYKNKRDFPRISWQVYKILKEQEPEIVHCHLFAASLIGLTIAKLAGVPQRIYTRHHSDYHHRYFPKGIKWDKWCNRMATTIVAPSNAVCEVLLSLEKVPASKIEIIHHGFDLNYFQNVSEERVQQLKRKYNTSDFYPVIGVVSRFTELKGIQYIIPAFQRLLKAYPKALLLLFNAQGDYAKQIKFQLSELRAEQYRLIPFEQDLSAVYRLFDVFVQASTDTTIEAFGQTYVESLASGVPSIFTLSGIAPDFVVHQKNALVVPFKSEEAIFEALLTLVQDPSLASQLKKEGPASVKEKFDLNVMIKKLEALYVCN